VRKITVISVYSVLTLSTLLVFWQVRNFDFAKYDDNIYVYENPHVLKGLTPDGIIWAFTTDCSAHWHPLTWLSLMLDCQLFGANPGRMHLMNVILHLVNTLLLFAILKKMTGALWPSAFVAAAFALHPMHVESVAWITERKDVLSTLFFLLTLAAYAGYVRRPTVFRYITALAAFALGLMAKPMLVTLPFLLILLDYWPLLRMSILNRQSSTLNSKFSILNAVFEKIPFFALSVVSSVITFLIPLGSGVMEHIDALSFKDRIANAFLSYARYIGKLFWPRNLAVFYPFDADNFASRQVAMCVLLLIVISILVIRFGQNRKYLPVGWFWFVGTLVPVIGFVQVGMQSLADRYTYIPYIGLFIMIAWGLPELLSKWPQRKIAFGLSMVIVLTTLGICTHQQVSYWNNSITLFSHAIEVTQNNYLAYNSLGVAYYSLGRYQETIESCKQAIKIKPGYTQAHYNLGLAYSRLGRWQEAVESNKQAVRIKPNYAEAHNDLGVTYGNLGRWQDAIEEYQQTIKIKPDYADAHYNLGIAYGKLGRSQEAIDAYRQAIRIKPGYAQAHYNLGVAYSRLVRWQEAVESYKQAVRIKPDYADAHYNLGVAYSRLVRWQEAVESYKQAVRIKPDYADAHYNLGIAYGSLGRYQETIKSCKQAIRIKPDYAMAHYALGVAYFLIGDKESALEEYKILKTMDADKANELFNLIHK
jgi:tetratricopeptide (TPR) repeat protein